MQSRAALSAENPSGHDVNLVVLSGTVVGKPLSGETRSASFAASLLLRVDGPGRSAFVVRVNAYDALAELLSGFLDGERVMLKGELITRHVRTGNVTELKAHMAARLNDTKGDANERDTTGQEETHEGS